MPDFGVTDSAGMLTKQQRKYLTGQTDLDSSTVRVIRQRVRDRIIQAIRDFQIVDIGLSKDDHAKIFEKGLGGDISPGGGHTPRTAEDDYAEFDFREGVRYGFAFLFEGMRSQGNDIDDLEHFLAGAIGHAESPGGGWSSDPDYTSISATVSIELEENPSLKQLYDQLQDEKRLTDEQLGQLVRAGKLTPDDLVLIRQIQSRPPEEVIPELDDEE